MLTILEGERLLRSATSTGSSKFDMLNLQLSCSGRQYFGPFRLAQNLRRFH